MRAKQMTKTGQIWNLPSGSTIQLSKPVDAKGNTSESDTGDWRAIYRGGDEEGMLYVSSRFLVTFGDLVGA